MLGYPIILPDIRVAEASVRCHHINDVWRLLALKNSPSDLAIEWCAMLWFDTTVFLLTLVRALRLHRRLSGGIVNVLFRDGERHPPVLVPALLMLIPT